MMRNGKDKFKRQEHFNLLNIFYRITYLTGQAFIDWFIVVSAKITRSGHQTEIKMYENHFHKTDWKELDILTGLIHRRLIEAA